MVKYMRDCLLQMLLNFEATKKINEDKAIDVFCMDLSKAFDKVPYGMLLWKGRLHGIQGTARVLVN